MDREDGISSWEHARRILKWQFRASATEQEIKRGYFDGERESRLNTFILLKKDRQNDRRKAPSESDPTEKLKDRLRADTSDRQSVQIYEKESDEDTRIRDAAKARERRTGIVLIVVTVLAVLGGGAAVILGRQRRKN